MSAAHSLTNCLIDERNIHKSFPKYIFTGGLHGQIPSVVHPLRYTQLETSTLYLIIYQMLFTLILLDKDGWGRGANCSTIAGHCNL
jgi:hypothetical protein